MIKTQLIRHLSTSLIALGGAALAACTGGDPSQGPAKTLEEASVEAATPKTKTLEFVSPEVERVSVSLAGADRPDISRFLMARGAGPAQISPNGQMVAFRSGVTGTRQLWVIPISGGQAEQITFGNGITFFAWAPDGTYLLYGADNDGDERESYFRISPDGRTETKLMPATDKGFRSFGGISADGATLAFASTERNGQDFDIYVADPQTGDSRRVYEGRWGNYVEAVSSDGAKLIVSNTVGEDANNIYLLDVESGERTPISVPDIRANHTDGGMVFSREGDALLFASNLDRETMALHRYDLESGEITVIYEDADRDVENLTRCDGGNDLAFTLQKDGFGAAYQMNATTGNVSAIDGLPEGVLNLSCAAQTSDLLVRVSAYDRPGDLFHVDLERGDVSQIFTASLAGLNPESLVAPQSLRMTARDGVELQGLLYAPKGVPAPPVVFDVHGGPSAQSRPDYRGGTQYLVSRGIAVFRPNVRGSTGMGRTYSTLDDRKKRLDSVRDLVDMLGALGEQGLVDPNRAAVKGGSYGGYMVNAVLGAYPDRFKVGVSLYGVADWVTALEIASPALKAADLIEYGNIEEPEWRAFYTENSPIRQADQIKVPVLYSHGAMDPRIDIAETETMVRALRANGIEAPFIRIPDEGHGWRKLSNQLFYARREAAFLEKHLGLDANPAPAE